MSQTPDQQKENQNNEENQLNQNDSNITQQSEFHKSQTSPQTKTQKAFSNPIPIPSSTIASKLSAVHQNQTHEIPPAYSTPIPKEDTRTRPGKKGRNKSINSSKLPDHAQPNPIAIPTVPHLIPPQSTLGIPVFPMINPVPMQPMPPMPNYSMLQFNRNMNKKQKSGSMMIPNPYYSNIHPNVPKPHTDSDLLSRLDEKSIDIIFQLFDLHNPHACLSSTNEFFSNYVNTKLSPLGPHIKTGLFTLIDQFENGNLIIQPFISPRIPIVFEKSNDHRIIYKFAPLNSSPFEIPLSNKPQSEYCIIAQLLLNSPNVNKLPITVNNRQVSAVSFGEAIDNTYFLIFSSAYDTSETITVQLHPTQVSQFCFMQFIYVAPVNRKKLEQLLRIDRHIKGLRTNDCYENCIFQFSDMIKNIYQYGYAICPNCKKMVFFNKLYSIPAHPTNQCVDNLSSHVIPKKDSMVGYYDYFNRAVKNYPMPSEDEKENNEGFDSNKYIEDFEQQLNSILNH